MTATSADAAGQANARSRLARSAAGASAAALAGAFYWTLMSPYSQALGRFPYRAAAAGIRGEKVVALTFDDGPNEPYTSEIADYLTARDIKATFFQVGRCIERHPDVPRKLQEAGHVIGNHSYSHRFSRCWSEAAIGEELEQSQQVFRDHLGSQPTLYRPPWLARTPAMFDLLKAHSLQAVSGEFCHPLEVFQPSAERIARGALAKARPGAIIIFHDGYDAKGSARSRTAAAVKIVVTTLLAQGFHFDTVDKLFGNRRSVVT